MQIKLCRQLMITWRMVTVARKSELLVRRCYNLPAYLMDEMLLLSPIIALCRDDQNMLQMD